MLPVKKRRVQRVRLAQPIVARLGALEVVLVDISLLGARVEHHLPITAGSNTRLTFRWEDEHVVLACEVVRSQLERLSHGADGLTVYHSGLEFINPSAQSTSALKNIIGTFISRALEEQKLNARGAMPPQTEKMPIFRFGQLASNISDKAEAAGSSFLPVARITKETGYVCYRLENRLWRRKRTQDPGQPPEGFTISAEEDSEQAELLCDAYERSDPNGRRMIQLFAQLSIIEGEGVAAGRFDP
jgi:PilZ domain